MKMKKLFACLGCAALITTAGVTLAACGGDGYVNVSTAEELVQHIEAGDNKIKLTSDITVDTYIEIKSNLTIDGQGHTIKAADTAFDSKNTASAVIYVSHTVDADLTLNDVKINGNNKVRGIMFNSDTLSFTNVTVENCMGAGKTGAGSYIGGVYVSYGAKFVMNSGKIKGNTVATAYESDNYLQYSADLWIGSDAKAEIKGGEIGNMFVNSTELGNQSGKTTVKGGKIDNLYVEYDGTNKAEMTYEDGTITKLMIATAEGVSQEVDAVKGTKYVGGKTDYTVQA